MFFYIINDVRYDVIFLETFNKPKFNVIAAWVEALPTAAMHGIGICRQSCLYIVNDVEYDVIFMEAFNQPIAITSFTV